MALDLVSVDITEVTTQRIGNLNLSLTDYTDGAEPEVTAGSWLENAGSLYYCSGDEDIDSTNVWPGVGASTLVYCYFSPATLQFYLSTTAPAWDDSKQGYYLAASPTHRCWGSIFKDAGNNYDQKTILIGRNHGLMNVGVNLGIGANADRELRFATDAIWGWDESEDEFITNKGLQLYHSQDGGADIQVATHTGAGGTTSADFTIMKPIAVYGVSSAGVGETGYIQLKYSGGYIDIEIDNFSSTNTEMTFMLNPGTYRIRHAGGNHTTTLYSVGTYGSNTVTASELVC